MRFCNRNGIPHRKFLEEWTTDDRAKALAFDRFESETCPMCGTQPWEWDETDGGSKFAYEPVPEICRGCERKEWAKDDTKHRPGLHVVLRKPEL